MSLRRPFYTRRSEAKRRDCRGRGAPVGLRPERSGARLAQNAQQVPGAPAESPSSSQFAADERTSHTESTQSWSVAQEIVASCPQTPDTQTLGLSRWQVTAPATPQVDWLPQRRAGRRQLRGRVLPEAFMIVRGARSRRGARPGREKPH